MYLYIYAKVIQIKTIYDKMKKKGHQNEKENSIMYINFCTIDKYDWLQNKKRRKSKLY